MIKRNGTAMVAAGRERGASRRRMTASGPLRRLCLHAITLRLEPVADFLVYSLRPQLAILRAMYDALTEFLQETGRQAPLLWALLVMAVVAGAALGLYVLWEVVLRWLAAAWAGARGRE